MQASQEWVEVISDIRSLKAECELLLKVVEVIEAPIGPGGVRSESSCEPEPTEQSEKVLYLA